MNRYRLGDEVTISVQCRDVNGVPANSDAAPVLSIYGTLAGVSEEIETLRMPPKNRHDAIGLFELTLLLDSDYEDLDQAITWRASWTVDGVAGIEAGLFHLVAGGDPDGTIEAAEFIDRRGSQHVLEQLSTQQYDFGHNPRL